MPPITIRLATPPDAEPIAQVHVASWRSTYRGLMPDALLDGLSVERRAAQWRRQLEDPAGALLIFVAEHPAEGVVGFVAAGSPSEPFPGYTAELQAIYLLEAHQRGGVGRALFRAAAAALYDRGHQSMFLWVLAGNAAQRFYEAMGGRMLQTAPENFGGAALTKIAYGWHDLSEVKGP